MRVLEGTAGRCPTALEEVYQVFRLERQGNLVAPRTLEFYDRRVGELLAWLRSEAPMVERVEDVGVNHLRALRVFMTERRRPDGEPLQAATLHASHRAIHTFVAWAELDGYGVDAGCSGCRRHADRTRRRSPIPFPAASIALISRHRAFTSHTLAPAVRTTLLASRKARWADDW